MDILEWAKTVGNKKIYIYGVCARGEQIHDYLADHKINVGGVVVSAEYSKEGRENVFYLNEIDAEEAALVLAIRYCHFNTVMPQIIKMNISSVYFLTGNDLKALQHYDKVFDGQDYNDYRKIEKDFPKRWQTYNSGKKVFEYLLDAVKIDSVVDFGCGSGAWLKAIKDLNPNAKVLGLDNTDMSRGEFLENDEFRKCDLSQKQILLTERYDLAMSIEVAEHMDEEHADDFVDNLCAASDIVLFSAAIKYQGGNHHVNEQLQSYWMNKFKKRGYEYIDCIRGHFWNDTEMVLHIRQNCILYVKSDKFRSLEERLREEKIVDMVHPELFELRMNSVYEGKY